MTSYTQKPNGATEMTKPLSTPALAIWEAFNDVSERVGVFEDYGDALAAALRALTEYSEMFYDPDEYADAVRVDDILKIVKELENV